MKTSDKNAGFFFPPSCMTFSVLNPRLLQGRMMGELQLCQLSQFITSLNVDCYAWCLEFDKATGFHVFSLKFHFLRE